MQKIAPKKEQDKTPERRLHETEITDLLDKNFKVIVISMLTDLQYITDDLRENVSKKKI